MGAKNKPRQREAGAVTYDTARHRRHYFAAPYFALLLLCVALLAPSLAKADPPHAGREFLDTEAQAKAACLAKLEWYRAHHQGTWDQFTCEWTNYGPGLADWSVWDAVVNYHTFTDLYQAVYPIITCPTGKYFRAPGKCSDPQEDKPLACGSAPQGNPCDAATGNKYQPDTDYNSNNTGLNFTRYYNSQLYGYNPAVSADAGLGIGWTSSYHKRLMFNGTTVKTRRAEGRGELFTCAAASCTGDADTKLALTGDGSGYTLTLIDGASERYDALGRLLSQTDRSGKITLFFYDASGRLITVTGPFGHTLSFTYDATGHVATITDAANRSYSYFYNDSNNLVRVRYPDGTSRLYHYEDTNWINHLTGISFDNGAGTVRRFATFGYDRVSGKALSTEHAEGQKKFSFTYDSDTQTTVADAANTRTVMTFAPNLAIKNLTNEVNQADGKSVGKAYDANNNLSCRKDEEGRVTTYGYNATNQRTRVTEGLAGDCANPINTAATRTTTYQYLSANLDVPVAVQTPSVFSGSGKTVAIAYDANGNPTRISQNGFTPDGGVVARTVTMGYNARGQLASIDGPRTDINDVTTLTYYECTTGGACGQLQRIANPLGQVTTFDNYDASGRLLQQTDPNGLRTTYSYDGQGRVSTLTQTPPAGAARTATFLYDAYGNLVSQTTPDGVRIDYFYDAAQNLIRVMDLNGNHVDYSYDLKGNRTSENTHDPDGRLVRAVATVYDLRNHAARIDAGGSVTQQVNDAIGNLLSQTDPNGNPATMHQYDALNRLFQRVDALTGVTNYAYDTNDRTVQVRAPNGATTQYLYDDLGNLLQETSPDRGTTVYVYDAAGNVLTKTDARGVVAAYTYDALNRVVSVNYPGTAEDVALTYDSGSGCSFGVGRLCAASDASGTTSYAYDSLGNVIQQVHSELNATYTTSYTYDAGNRVRSITYPDGRIINYSRNAIGLIDGVSMTTAAGTRTLLSGVVYRADRLPVRRDFGNTVEELRAYDQQGALTSQSLSVLTEAPPPVSSVTVAPDLASPRKEGTSITFTAQAAGTTGIYEYRFLFSGPATNNVPVVKQPYSRINTWTFTSTTADVGLNYITVQTRNLGSTADVEASASVEYPILSNSPAPATGVTLTADPPSPHNAGPMVTLVAQATGGTGPYEYRFYYVGPDGNWVIVRDYSTSNIFVWDTSAAIAGNHAWQAWVRTLGSTVERDVYGQLGYNISSSAVRPPSSVAVTKTPASPQPAGTTITLSADAAGGTGPYEYRFWQAAPGGEWHVVQEYSTNNSYVWTATTAQVGTNLFQVHARNAGSLVYRDTLNQFQYVIQSTTALAPGEISEHAAQTTTVNDQRPGDPPSVLPEKTVIATTTTVLIISQPPEQIAQGDTHRFWINGPSTGGQWLAVRDYKPYLKELPEVLAVEDGDTVHVWEKVAGEAAEYTYRDIPRDPLKVLPVAWTGGVYTVAYQYDLNGNLLSRSTPEQTLRYGYDALDRLIEDAIAGSPPSRFQYDANGNRTSNAFDAFAEGYAYAPGSNRLTQKGNQAVTTDAAGYTLSDRNGNRLFSWNHAGQLATVTRQGVVRGTYTYNYLNQRTRKVQVQVSPTGTLNTSRFVYHYDLNGNLLAETRPNGTLVRLYVWVENEPIVQIQNRPATQTEELIYLHTDHLGMPRLATNDAQTIVWRFEPEAFGTGRPDTDPDADEAKTQVRLRFPGQYADGESGLIYNWNNYYDPRTGRWIATDRMSVAAHVKQWRKGFGTLDQVPLEINPYAYVLNNPLKYVDPTGFLGNFPGQGTYRPGHGPISFIEAIGPGPFGPVCGSGSGATWVPDGPWKEACQKHDDCYSRCGVSRFECDINFLFDSYGNLTYFLFVRRFGTDAFNAAQNESCCNQKK